MFALLALLPPVERGLQASLPMSSSSVDRWSGVRRLQSRWIITGRCGRSIKVKIVVMNQHVPNSHGPECCDI